MHLLASHRIVDDQATPLRVDPFAVGLKPELGVNDLGSVVGFRG